MNETQRALYRMIAKLLVRQVWPSGRPMTDREWWATLNVLELVGGMR